MNEREVYENWKRRNEQDPVTHLVLAMRKALRECTSGEYVDRAIRAQQVLEDALLPYGFINDEL